MAEPIPTALVHLIALNPVYNVLICKKCQYVLMPLAMSRHLHDQHQTPIELRRQVNQYIDMFQLPYEHAAIPLPNDGSAPQPIIPVVDGFACRECTYKTRDRSNIRKHGNKAHNKKRIADEDMFQVVRLQSWFGQKREQYWVVDESQQAIQARQARRAAIQDVGEALEPSPEPNIDSGSESDEIMQEIEQWKAEAQARRLQALQNVPVVEMDSWLQYTGWNAVLNQSKHDIVKTYQFTREPEDEPELSRVVRAWKRILERCLDTLEAINQKDTLKWWKSPKNEAAD